MRLINVETLRLETFNDDSKLPLYAIFSHARSDSEITFDEFSSVKASDTRAGYYKIIKTYQQAQSDNTPYLWVDTCAIDKRSLSELQESINSMYRWYENAEIHYAYLDDLEVMDRLGYN